MPSSRSQLDKLKQLDKKRVKPVKRAEGSPESGEAAMQMTVGTPLTTDQESPADTRARQLLRALSEGARGFFGANAIQPGSEAYRTGQAFANMPAVGVAAGAVRGAGKVADEAIGLGERAADALLQLNKSARDRAIIEAAEASRRAFLAPSKEKDVWYHGTRNDIKEFKTGERGAVFLTKDPQFASEYAPTSQMLFLNELPNTPNVMPVLVQVKNPFDYENPKHIEKVLDVYKKPKNVDINKVKENLELGNWNYIEDKNIQKAIKESGFDGFYIKEQGLKNLGVYDPKTIKSAIGMQGRYDTTTPVINKANGGEVLSFLKKSSKRR